MSIEQGIRAFVERFYAALNAAGAGDCEALLGLWAHGPEATLLSAGGQREMGWLEVSGAVTSPGGGHPLRPREVSIRLLTADVAVVSALESAGSARVPARCTLVLRRDGEGWKAVHRHLDRRPLRSARPASPTASAPAFVPR